MKMDYKSIKSHLKNVYFINGTAYAGKSTVCKLLAEKYNMYHCEENYKFGEFLKLTNEYTHPNMNYFKTMKNWEEFVLRSKEEYESWIDGVSLETTEFEIAELMSLSKDQKVIVDTNIPHHILKKISDRNHVVYMVSTPDISTNHFFNRPDSEKQFLLDVISKIEKPKEALKKFKETISYINRQERIDEFINSGYYVIRRKDIDEDINEKVKLVEAHFKLKQN
ncbi:hypothetical protein RJI07_04655 [Mycoplasmatota bacterium WC30]